MSPQVFPIPRFQLRKYGALHARWPKLTPGVQSVGTGHFTEFYCTSGGSNLNSGSDENNSAKFTSTNGNWNATTFIFTPTDSTNPVSAGVAVGDWASIYIDGASVGVYVARILSVVDAANGAIAVSNTFSGGTAPTTSATTRTIRVGGAWRGPTGSTTWPFSMSLAGLRDSLGNWCKVNLKNNQTYSITTGLLFTGLGSAVQGYSLTLNDAGKSTIDGGSTNMNIVTLQSGQQFAADLILQNNGSSAANHGITTSASSNFLYRISASNIRGNGFNLLNSANNAVECEAYLCNKSNTALGGGFSVNSSSNFVSCISHDNAGSNSSGFTGIAGATGMQFINCIAHRNGQHGFSIDSSFSITTFWHCDAYHNAGDGIKNRAISNISSLYLIRNSNFLRNGGFAINSDLVSGTKWFGRIEHCGFGSGPMKNFSGKFNNIDSLLIDEGCFDYPNSETPYLDPDNGKFDLVLPEALSTGRGTFTTTASNYGPTVGYPDVGAAPAQSFVQTWDGADQILPVGYLNHSYFVEWTFLASEVITLQAGSLPNGLVLIQIDSDHVSISGTPTVIGSFNFTLRATIGAATGDATFHITILQDPGLVLSVAPEWGTFEFPKAYIGVPYEFEWFLENIDFPCTYSLVSGTLPSGFILETLDATALGRISGTALALGDFTFTLRATNPAGTADKEFTISVLPDPNEGAGYIYGN